MGMRGGRGAAAAGGWGGPPPKKVDKATIRRISSSFKPYMPQVILIALLVVLSALISIANPLLLRNIVDNGLKKNDMGVVKMDSLLTLVATISSTALSIGFGYLSVLVGQKIMQDLRNQLFLHLQGMSLRFYTNTKTGELQSRITNDVTSIQSVVSDTVANILSNVTTALTTVVAMFWLDWRLTCLSIGVLPIFAMVATKVGDWGNKYRKKSQEHLAEMTATTNETLSVSGILLTKVTGRRQLAVDRFSKENANLTATQVTLSTIMRGFFNMFGLVFTITPVLVYWLAGWLIIDQKDPRLTLGTIVAFTAMQARLFFPITSLLNTQVELRSSMALFERIYEYLDLNQEIKDKPNAEALTPATTRGEVEFRNVSFRYDEDQERPTLDNISLDAKPGELIALVGHSGSGKTSMTYLIPRLYDVDGGAVLIDGHDVRDVKLDSLASIMAVVTQETYLVHDTIRENLRYGNPEATDDQIEAAARSANIFSYIDSLPDRFDTVVGERGYKLSGGEKQRIAIARAILRDPRILILDEATSALDNESERLVQGALSVLMKGRTTFAVAHRLSTIIGADQILVLREGQIVERGNHEQLIAMNGEYRRLYDLQFEAVD